MRRHPKSAPAPRKNRGRADAGKGTPAERRVDLAYSMASWPTSIGTTPIFFIAAYLNQITGVSLALLGLIATVARIYDAAYNPLVGILSDRIRTPIGRRKPLVLIGHVVMIGTLLVGVFVLPTKASQFSAAGYALGLAVFFTAWTTALVPYSTHVGEITTDYDRRSRINLQQGVISIISSLVTYGVPYLLVDPDLLWLRKDVAALLPHIGLLDGVRGFLVSKALSGVANYGRVMIVLAWMTIITSPVLIWRYMRYVPEAPIPAKSKDPKTKAKQDSLLLPLRNPFYLTFCGGYLIFMAGYVGRLSLYPFIVPYATGGGYSFLLLMQIQGISGIVATPVWSRIFMKLERGQVMLAAAIIEAIGLICLGLSTHGMPYLTIVGSIATGLPGGTVMMVPFLIAAEVADYSSMKDGADTRGLHSAVIGFIHKIGNFLATAVLAIAGALGFNPAHGVTTHDVATIKWLGLYGPAILVVIGGLVMVAYPITRRRHTAIQTRIDRRARVQGFVAVEPPLPPLPGLPEIHEIKLEA